MSKGEINLGFVHEKNYWNINGRVEAETFAQFGRMMFTNPDSMQMMEENFPNLYKEVTETIERKMK